LPRRQYRDPPPGRPDPLWNRATYAEAPGRRGRPPDRLAGGGPVDGASPSDGVGDLHGTACRIADGAFLSALALWAYPRRGGDDAFAPGMDARLLDGLPAGNG